MHISGLKQSRFLTRADVGAGVLATIKGVYQDNIAKEGAPEELKWVVEFEEIEKPMVLNSTNGQIIAQITKQDDTDNWAGAKVVLYDDPSVSYGGKLVGGIRVRAPRVPATKPVTVVGKPVHQAKVTPRPEELTPDEDTPF
jgi:hypothetical protein